MYSLLVFFAAAFIIIDVGVSMVNAELRNYLLRYNVIHRKVMKEKAKREKYIIKERLTNYKNRGFAYSGEAGNNAQVTDQLTNKLQNALR